jgi:two-component system, NarL family, nitrate/nitrite response regulator NarL
VVRVKILAGTPTRERELAELLAEDVDIEVSETADDLIAADVLVVADGQLPSASTALNVVYVGDGEPGDMNGPGRAWLPRNISASQLIATVLAAAQDLTVLTREQILRGHFRVPRESALELLDPLTNRELQVLRMVADGLLNKEIAGKLGISDHTAKFHVAQILAKLGAASRTEAVTIAIRRGLVPI